ncbi:NPCBM/NEW2 domain-containing protein [Amycolatopsis sp. H20-H5]|uniref:NPCBM/NEW2 domain-containing protein n=1 Tax=Amycolatopsis sp. H20-H5 TaxID=3046309 RepID=UPI002DBABE9C|nr:NPCBM/NEW2 domain-containing protein [Amycolatopsis sp. H20-H5]MEC3979659.1 NPCBM/NEW2 domain-containing protein [Amycolatopsis sp. H20-H5]
MPSSGNNSSSTHVQILGIKLNFWSVVIVAILGVVSAAVGGYFAYKASQGPSESKSSGATIASPSASVPSPTSSQKSAASSNGSSPDVANVQYLSDPDMKPVGAQSVMTGTKNLAGTDFPHSIYRGLNGCKTASTVEYKLGGSWKKFDATVGLDQTSRPNTVARMTVFVDKTPIGNGYIVTPSARQNIPTIDVTGAQYLALEMLPTSGDLNSCVAIGDAVWGDARLSR